MAYDYLFFDLDGTLTDPAEGITNSFIYALKYFGIEVPSYETLCTYIGPPLVTTWKEQYGFDDEKAAEGVKKYREYFADKGLFENKVYPGIPELLRKLKAAGKHLYVATSKPEEYSKRIMDKFDLSKYFEAVCGSNIDETRSTKAEVVAYTMETAGIKNPDNILMIGDRKHDVIGSKENGIKCCGVLFGYGNRQELEEAGAAFIASDINELEKILINL